jgi:hypothetical protein
MGQAVEPLLENPVARETIRLAVEIQALDARTSTMLVATQTETRNAINSLEHGRRKFAAYLQSETRGFKCDRRA